jgi:replicative DNA helicase
MAQKISLTADGSVLFFSLEMTKEELTDRIICSMAEVMSYKMQTGDLNDKDWVNLYESINKMEKARLHIDEDGSLTMFGLRAKAKRFAATNSISLIVVDYLQLMSLGQRVHDRQQEVADMTRGLKLLAKELDVPILALSQLNRNPEGRRTREPELSDLRESGAIEQDADVVMFIHFDPEEESGTMARVLVKKNRHGATGAANLVFIREYTRFRDEGRASQ